MDNWRDYAECADRDVNLFFPSEKNRAGEAMAKAICFSCPVIAQCLDRAMIEEGKRAGRYGIRGGRTAEERRRLARRLTSLRKRT